jgi:predicted 3-demethylubiquinone-9 3-methyltransferase (glyoxalase superfamily)
MTKTFFASRFGMIADRFGVSWMVIVMARGLSSKIGDFYQMVREDWG